jgi:hypothetical protein
MFCSIELGAHWEEDKIATQAIASAKERDWSKPAAMAMSPSMLDPDAVDKLCPFHHESSWDS